MSVGGMGDQAGQGAAAGGTTVAGIPRIIHQTYPTLDLPPILAANVAKLRTQNPTWEHRLYDDAAIESFILAEYGSAVLASYNRIEARYGAARADLFRYLLINRVGGLYLDIKSGADRPLDDIFREDDTFIISQWRARRGEPHEGWGWHWELRRNVGGEFQQWFIAAVSGHPFLAAVIARVLANIDTYSPYRHGVGRAAVLRITGPIAYTQAISPLLPNHTHRRVLNESVLGLRYSIVPGTEHRRFFARHYQDQHLPLIGPAPGWAGRLAVRLAAGGRMFRHKVFIRVNRG